MSEPTFVDPPGFDQLTKADQLRYVQMPWDKISARPDDVRVPDGRCAELQDRLADYKNHPDQVSDARDVLDRLSRPQKMACRLTLAADLDVEDWSNCCV